MFELQVVPLPCSIASAVVLHGSQRRATAVPDSITKLDTHFNTFCVGFIPTTYGKCFVLEQLLRLAFTTTQA